MPYLYLNISKILVPLIILISISDCFYEVDSDDKHEAMVTVSARRVFYRTRCTRRFTSGVCMEPVEVVWTYVFQMQNCTERMGCPRASRTNRFSSYKRCMKRCGALAELYGQLLMVDQGNETAIFQIQMHKNYNARREGPELTYDQDSSTTEDSYDEYKEMSGDAPLTVGPLKESDLDDELIPPDIDYVAPDKVPNLYDLFHDGFGRSFINDK